MMLWLILTFVSIAQTMVKSAPVRICVPSSLATSCAEMAADLPETFSCVIAPDSFGCLEKITSGEADITNVDPNGLYLAGKYFNLKPIVTELEDGKPYSFQGIALVAKKDPAIQSVRDLKGKRSCHTGFGRTDSWHIQVGKLLAENVMEPSCEKGELAAVSNFFSGGCIAGNWTKDPVLDKMLKEQYPNMINTCQDPACSTKADPHHGYNPTIRCLIDGHGDVAFTQVPALRLCLSFHPDVAEKVELLCLSGGRKHVHDGEPCVWGEKPTNVYVSRAKSEKETKTLVTAMLNTQKRYSVPQVRIPQWYHKTFLSHDKVSGIRRTVDDRRTYKSYLGEFINSIRKPRPGCTDEEKYNVNYCATSYEEEFKCQDYSRAAQASGFWPKIGCVRAASKVACMETIKNGNAHLVSLDEGDIYKAGRYYSLVPLAAEEYNDTGVTHYAVAVQRSKSNIKKLSELRGARSCHPGMDSTAGWVMPIGALLSQGLLSSENTCNHASTVAEFFSGGSCVPGANDTKYNPQRIRSEELCKHCMGLEDGHKCHRDPHERYNGYDGAFRCVVEGKGDIAFVKHSTVPDYTDGESNLRWARDLLSSDFKLLCSEGGTAPISDYLKCNLGKVPAQYVMTADGISTETRTRLSTLMTHTAHYLSHDSLLYNVFHKRVKSDAIFKNTASDLKVVPPGTTYEEVLGKHFLEASRAVDPKDCS